MSDQPTANVEDSDVWHDANSYYGDEMTFDVSAARQRAETALRLAWARGNPVARYAEEATKALARDVVTLADRVEAADQALVNAEREATHGQTASFAFVMQCIGSARAALSPVSPNTEETK